MEGAKRWNLDKEITVARRMIYEAIKSPKPTMLRVACSDPRFRIAFRDFTTEGLGFYPGQFVPISVGGGPAALAHRKNLDQDFDFLMRQIKFFLSHFPSIKTVIIIAHQDCGYYKTIPNHPDPNDKEKRDLPRASAVLRRHFPGVEIIAYYASFSDAERRGVAFEEINELAIA